MEHDKFIIVCPKCSMGQTVNELKVSLATTNGYLRCYCKHCDGPLGYKRVTVTETK